MRSISCSGSFQHGGPADPYELQRPADESLCAIRSAIFDPMAAQVVKIGIAISLSGRYAPQGRQCLAAIEAYLRVVERAGGVMVGGRPMPARLTPYDDRSREARVQEAVHRLIHQDEVDILLGPYGSGLTMAAAEVAERSERLLWNHGGAADAIFQRGFRWMAGILSPTDRYLSSVLDYLKASDPAARRVALCHAETSFGRNLAAGARRWIAREDYTIVLERSYPSGASDFDVLMGALRDARPEVVLGAGRFEDDIAFARALREQALGTRAVAVIAAGVEAFGAQLGDSADGFLAPSQWEATARYPVDYGPSASEFSKEYRQGSSVPLDYPAAQAYAACLVAERCIQIAGSLEQAKLRAAAARARFSTFYGPYGIDAASGRQEAHPMLVVQWQHGVKTIVWPPHALRGQ